VVVLGEVILARIDPQHTEQVNGNLVSNALRYVPSGGQISACNPYQADYR